MIDVFNRRPLIYTAYSKHYFFAKMLISAFVLNEDVIPLNPFTNWGYYLDDLVERDYIVRGNNNLILVSDEVWTFGPIADGVFSEILFAKKLGKKLRHFSIGKTIGEIRCISSDELIFEEELLLKFSEKELLSKLV